MSETEIRADTIRKVLAQIEEQRDVYQKAYNKNQKYDAFLFMKSACTDLIETIVLEAEHQGWL